MEELERKDSNHHAQNGSTNNCRAHQATQHYAARWNTSGLGVWLANLEHLIVGCATGYVIAFGRIATSWSLWEKKPERKRKNLMQLGVDYHHAYAWSRTRNGGWAIAQSPILTTTITLERLAKRGYESMLDHYKKIRPEQTFMACPERSRSGIPFTS